MSLLSMHSNLTTKISTIKQKEEILVSQKEEEIVPLATTWLNLGDVTVNKIGQVKKATRA